MKEVLRKEILLDLDKAIKILEKREPKDYEELKELSNHATEDAALHKDLDMISIAVLLYSTYKVLGCITEENYKQLLRHFTQARKALKEYKFRMYNQNIQKAFGIIKHCSPEIKEHLQDVLQAAKIKKGSILLEKGFSIGQAAGLMGLSNWDLQEYVGKTAYAEGHHEAVSAKKRLQLAINTFTSNKKPPMVFFDAGPIITLVMSRLTWILPELKKQFGGKFYITPAVRYELIERPLTVNRFKFEALEVMKLLREGTLEIYQGVSQTEIQRMKKLANGAFKIKNKTMDIVQAGEMESVSAALQNKGAVVVMDERTLRLLIENRKEVRSLLMRRFKRKVDVDTARLAEFSKLLKQVPIIRSIELAAIAFKQGMLDSYLPKKKNARVILLDAILWATKLNGAATTTHEITELKQALL